MPVVFGTNWSKISRFEAMALHECYGLMDAETKLPWHYTVSRSQSVAS